MNAYSAYPGTLAVVARQVREAVLDHEAFERKIRACELERCRATCCHDGVYLSPEEVESVGKWVAENENLATHLKVHGGEGDFFQREKSGKIKTATRMAEVEELATDYPAHFPKTRCVFLDREGRCALQVESLHEGRHPWYDKPLTCWIHPLVILPAGRQRSRPLLTLVSPENDPQKSPGYPGFASCTHCGRPDADGEPARMVLRAELGRLGEIAGRNVLAELDADEAGC